MPVKTTQPNAPIVPYRDAKREFERQYWTAALAACGGSRVDAARAAGINRTHIWRVLRRSGAATIRPQVRRPGRWAEFGL